MTKKILLTNDDGYDSAGIKNLFIELSKDYDVYMVVPSSEKSASGHSITVKKPIKIEKIEPKIWLVDGTPADCVHIGLRGLLSDPVDWVISGINRGANMGDDVFYSGTVAAAREAIFHGIPAVAFSYNNKAFAHLEDSVHLAKELFNEIVTKNLPQRTLLNINFPDLPREKIKGVQVTSLGRRFYDPPKLIDRNDNQSVWTFGDYKGYDDISGTDCKVCDEGYISFTTIHVCCACDLVNKKVENQYQFLTNPESGTKGVVNSG